MLAGSTTILSLISHSADVRSTRASPAEFDGTADVVVLLLPRNDQIYTLVRAALLLSCSEF